MTSPMLPLLVELFTTLLFFGALIYLRPSMTRRGVALWVVVWLLRGAISVMAMNFLAITERSAVLVYAPLQIAFSMALVVIAVRLENQKQQLRSLNEELVRLRRDAVGQQEFDPLTALRSRSALARWLDQETGSDGLMVVCDLDDFKLLNDRYGHLVGDEVLHGVGKLIAASIRESDMAFRWGGDEFVIFFHTKDMDLVSSRLRHIEDRLQHFQIRQHGTIPVQFSWGLVATAGRPLRDSLDEADRLMYDSKRTRRVSQLPDAK